MFVLDEKGISADHEEETHIYYGVDIVPVYAFMVKRGRKDYVCVRYSRSCRELLAELSETLFTLARRATVASKPSL